MAPRSTRLRLNGWQRIGIVLSVVWVIAGGFIGYYMVLAPMRTDLEYCLSDTARPGGADVNTCWAIYREEREHADPWPTAATVALAPIPIAWLLVYGLIGLVRWIRGGFTRA